MSRRRKSITVNFLYNMVYQISLVIIPLITAPYLTRVMGPKCLGEYAYSYSIAYMFYLISLLGIVNYGSRSIAAIRDKKNELDFTFSQIFYFQVFSSSVVSIMYLIYSTNLEDSSRILGLAQIPFVMSALINVDWFFNGLEEFRLTVARKTLIKVVVSFCIFLFVKNEDDLLLYTLIISLGEFFSSLFLFRYVFDYVSFCKVPIKSIFRDYRSIVALFIPIIATSMYRYLDKVLLGIFGKMSDVGQFDYAEKIIMISLGCLTALGTVMLPKMSNLIANNNEEVVSDYLIKSMKFAMFISCGIMCGMASLGEQLAVTYFGSQYVDCGKIIRYLSITVLPIAWANVIRTQYLIPNSKDKEYISSVVIGGFINILLNIVLIPIIGLNGAIIATLVAEFAVAITQTFFVKNYIDIKIFCKNMIPYLVISMIVYILIICISSNKDINIVDLFIKIILCITTYVLLCVSYSAKYDKELFTFLSSKINSWCK